MATVVRPRYAAHWKAVHDRQDWDLLDRQARHRYSEPVNFHESPGGIAEIAWNQYLILRLWAGGRTSDLARYCLEVAHDQAAQALAANRFAESPPPGAYPLNRFRLLACKIFIDGVVEGKPLDREAARQMADVQSEVAPTYGRREWDAFPQSDYIHCVEVLLLADEYERAEAMLRSARAMGGLHIADLAASAKLIAKRGGLVKGEQDVRDKYVRTFDLLRDPSYADGKRGHPAFLHQLVVMACVLQKFFEPGDGEYDYDRAIELIAA